MKALGTGSGASACATSRWSARPARAPPPAPRRCAWRRRRPSWPGRAGSPGGTCRSPTPPTWRWPWSWPSAPAAECARWPSTVAETRAADAAALAGGWARPSLVARAGTAVALARPCGCSAAATAAGWRWWPGKGNNGADGRVAASVLAPPGRRGCTVLDGGRRAGPPARRATSWSTPPTAPGFRGTYEAPEVPARARRAGGRHPLGGRRRHRGGLGPADGRPSAP